PVARVQLRVGRERGASPAASARHRRARADAAIRWPQSHPHRDRRRGRERGPRQETMMTNQVGRRDFLAGLGVALGSAAAGDLAVAGVAAAQDAARGRVPETPVKFGHITIQSGPGAILGLPSLKGHTLAAEEINAAGGLLGKRKIETITADE